MIPPATIHGHPRTLARCAWAVLVATAILAVTPPANAARPDGDECAAEAPVPPRAGPVARKRAPPPKHSLRSKTPPADVGTDANAASGTIRRVHMRPIPLQCVPNELLEQARASGARAAGPSTTHLAARTRESAALRFSPREAAPA